MANGQLPDDVTFSPPTSSPAQSSSAPADMSDVTFTPPAAPRIPDTGFTGVLSGIGAGALESVEGLKKVVETMPGPGPVAKLIPDIPEKYREATSPSEKIGSGLENIGEFFAGDAALEGLMKMAKMAKVAPGVIELAEKYPKAAKIFTGGVKGAVVGGAQGGVKGAAEGEAAKGAEGGATGGAVGGLVGETASEIAGELGKRFGIGTTAVEDATRGAKPGKRNYKFAEDFQRAAPYMDAEHQVSPNKTLEDWADATDDARKRLWADRVQKVIDKPNASGGGTIGDQPLSGMNIATYVRSKIPPAMIRNAPAEAKKMEDLANQFVPGGMLGSQAVAVPTKNIFIKNAEEDLEFYNAMLSKTGYWSKLPSERAELLKTDGDVAGYKALADAIREEFYTRLEQLEPGANMAEMKKDYGALRNVGNELRGQVNVQNRQAPISLKEAIGAITGLAHGGAMGGVAAALPFVDRAVNAPEKLVGRAVQKAARPGATTTGKVVQKAGRAAVNTGEALSPQVGRYLFTASDGSQHSVDDTPENREAVSQIDPNHTPIQ